VTPSVRFEVEADEEYRAAARWYEDKRTGLGLDFLNAVNSTLSQVVRFPRGGAPVAHIAADLQVRRAPVGRFPFNVIYMETPTAVRILAIAHERRRPGYWTHRL
jgi:plasmid stabilization system protein ParE